MGKATLLKRNTLPEDFWRHPVHLLACGLGSGAAPFAPGTAGTLAAIPLFLVLRLLPAGWYLAAVGALFGLGVWVCHVTARDFGVHDHSGIVWDEFVGFFVTMTLAPAGWRWLAAGFLLFRVFDIVKPWPGRWVDRNVGGGLGIMLDDVVAGVYAWAALQVGAHFLAS